MIIYLISSNIFLGLECFKTIIILLLLIWNKRDLSVKYLNDFHFDDSGILCEQMRMMGKLKLQLV